MPSSELRPLSAEDAARLDALETRLATLQRYSVGYPCNHDFDFSALQRFLAYSINNVGDPFAGTNYAQNSHDFEREVVAEFAELAGAGAGGVWGYVTSGGTEGNMYGLYLARELHPEGMVYFSQDTHYSVAKILRLQHTRNIMIRSLPCGAMDCEDLRETLRIHRDVPPIIFANIGTTMRGACDDLAAIRGILDELSIPSAYIHADAALSGLILPFLDDAPPWNFAHGADSISISGHKMLGAPIPCGIALARKGNVDRIARSVEYVGALDTTITGSRNGLAVLMLWLALRQRGREGMKTIAHRCIDTAQYCVGRLRAAGIDAWRNPASITVVFPRPPEALFAKWIIAPQKKIGHLIAMPHVTREVIDEFTADFAAALENKPLQPRR